MQQPNKHKFDNDLTRLVPAPGAKSKNPLLEHIEEVPIPARKSFGATSQRQLHFREALELMEVCKDSLLIEKADRYHIEKAAKRLDYRLTYRVENNRGIKLYRYWVASRSKTADLAEGK